MGILNRTTDSFYDHGSYFDLDRFFERAEQLVEEGADVLDVGGVKAGPGPEVTEAEELERVVPVIAALRDRFDVPLVGGHLAGVGCRRPPSPPAPCSATTSAGSPTPSTSRPLPRPRAAVVATHIRLAPRVPDPTPHYDDVVAEVERFLLERAERAPRSRDPGRSRSSSTRASTSGRRRNSRCCSCSSRRGWPRSATRLLLSSSNKTFLGVLLELGIDERRERLLGVGGRRDRRRVPASCESTTSPAPARCATCLASILEARAGPGLGAAGLELSARGEPATPAGDAAIFVVKGSDPALVDRGVEQLLAELTSSRSDARRGLGRDVHGRDIAAVRGRSPSRSRSTEHRAATRASASGR